MAQNEDEPRAERRLVAILAADIAAYSTITGIDEEATLRALKGQRKALIDLSITAHRGRIVRTTGDGMLVEFASAVDWMRRRDFLTGLLLAAMLQRVQAQQPAKVFRIAIVHPSHPVTLLTETGGLSYWQAFLGEVRRLGYVEGRNLVVERLSGEGRTGHYPEVAREAVRHQPDVIVVESRRLAQHLKDVTTTIPIVAFTADPVATGLVPSLAHPGGNITGMAVDAGLEILDKRLELIREAVPTASKVGFLAPLAGWEGPYGREMRKVAERLGVSLIGPPLGDPIDEAEYRRCIAAMAHQRADVLIVTDHPENSTYQRLIVELAEKSRLPAVYSRREFVDVGGLMSYGVDFTDAARRMAGYVDRILRGTNPGEIPFYQPTRFDLIINLKTARVLGLTIPLTLLARADEVIE
jgi:putative tryptophan/tyrosine transport system substrate-binding protein